MIFKLSFYFTRIWTNKRYISDIELKESTLIVHVSYIFFNHLTNPVSQGNIPTIKNLKGVLKMLCDELYNELCQLLTNFETGERPVDANDFYSLLVKIQNNWELVVHCQ